MLRYMHDAYIHIHLVRAPTYIYNKHSQDSRKITTIYNFIILNYVIVIIDMCVRPV